MSIVDQIRQLRVRLEEKLYVKVVSPISFVLGEIQSLARCLPDRKLCSRLCEGRTNQVAHELAQQTVAQDCNRY